MHIHFQKIRSMGKNALYVRFDTPSPPLDPLSLARALCAEESGVGASLLVCLFPSEAEDVALRAFTAKKEVYVPDTAIRAAGKILYDAHELPSPNVTVRANGGCHRLHVETEGRYRATVTMAMGQVSPLTDAPDKNAIVPVYYEKAEANGYVFDYTAMRLDTGYAVSFVENVQDPMIDTALPSLREANGGLSQVFCTLRSRNAFDVRVATLAGQNASDGYALATAMAVAVTLGLADYKTHLRITLADEPVICVVQKDLSVLLNASVKLLFAGEYEYDNEYDDAFDPQAPTSNPRPS